MVTVLPSIAACTAMSRSRTLVSGSTSWAPDRRDRAADGWPLQAAGHGGVEPHGAGQLRAAIGEEAVGERQRRLALDRDRQCRRRRAERGRWPTCRRPCGPLTRRRRQRQHPIGIAAGRLDVERSRTGRGQRRGGEPVALRSNVAAGSARRPVTLAWPVIVPPRSWPGATALSTASGNAFEVTSSASAPPSSGTAPLHVAPHSFGADDGRPLILSVWCVDVPRASIDSVAQAGLTRAQRRQSSGPAVEGDVRALARARDRGRAVDRAAERQIGRIGVGDRQRQALMATARSSFSAIVPRTPSRGRRRHRAADCRWRRLALDLDRRRRGQPRGQGSLLQVDGCRALRG